MSGSGKRTHQRHLAKVAKKRQQTRAAEQRRRRMQMGVASMIAALLIVTVGGIILFKPAAKGAATASKSPSVAPTASPSSDAVTQTGTVKPQGKPPTTVACGGSLPTDAGKPKPQFSGPPKQTIKPDDAYTAIMSTSCGTIEI